MSPAHAILTALLATADAETVVSAPAADGEVRARLDDEAGAADPSSALMRLPGVTLLHDGAPLAPTRVVIRGVSGARMSASMAGLTLNDPLDGLLDVEAVPWLAVRVAALDANGRGLRLEPDARTPLVNARVVAGSLATVRAGALVAVPTPGGSLLVVADAGTTRGDFAFAVPSPTEVPGPVLVRTNDDHRRASALAVAQQTFGDVRTNASLLAAWHEGGVPGFATHPTALLRREDLLAAASARATVTRGPLAFWSRATWRGARRATWEGAAPSTSRSGTHATVLRGEAGATLEGADTRVDLLGAGEHAAIGTSGSVPSAAGPVSGGLARGIGALGSSAHVALPIPLDARILTGLTIDGAARAELVSDVGPLFSGHVRVAQRGPLALALTVSRNARAPTLDELYAPRGFVLGNPALEPEVLEDVDVSARVRLAPTLEVDASVWAGRIDNTILYLNANAFEIRPENTGPALRGGAEGAVRVAALPGLGVETVVALLASRLDATAAPLPLAPAFVASTSLRAGTVDGAHGVARVTSRSASTASLFGTLEVPATTLVDLLARYPVGGGVVLGVSIKNIFDVLDARDQNGLPLPGRLLFASLEVHG